MQRHHPKLHKDPLDNVERLGPGVGEGGVEGAHVGGVGDDGPGRVAEEGLKGQGAQGGGVRVHIFEGATYCEMF